MRPVPNLTLRREDGRVVAESVTVADSTLRRLRGLLGKRDLPSGYGVLLRPAWSIHTAFMRFPIDVVFLDPDQVVIKIVPNLTRSRRRRAAAPARSSSSVRASASVAAWRSATASRGRRGRPTRSSSAVSAPPTSSRSGAGAVVLASSDQRYLKLVRFLLDGKGIDVVATSAAHTGCRRGRRRGRRRRRDRHGRAWARDYASPTSRGHGDRRPRSCSSATTRPSTRRTGSGCTAKWDDTDGVVEAIEDALAQRTS